jgi:Ca-activated chloride channel family protein
MVKQSYGRLLLFVGLLALAAAACSLGQSEGTAGGPPRNALVVEVTANSSLGPWLRAAVASFNEAGVETEEGKPVYVNLTLTDSGQAATDIAAGRSSPALWIPEEQVWVEILADEGISEYEGDCQSVASSPLVIAMWRQVAESLGWPGLPLGWLDIGSLAADPSSWNYYSGGEYGDSLRLGHTHPGLSGSGASTLLAIVQAAASKADSVTVEDVGKPIVQASVSAFEAAVSTFSPTTEALGQAMGERGVAYLGAGVMYESDVLAHGQGQLVPIYPLEGTFVASHPACLSNAAGVETSEAARLFRDYLLGEEAQQLAVNNGLRPVSSSVIVGAPLVKANGVDLSQPQIVFNRPSVDTVYAVQDLWQSARKDVNLVMLLDVSGSMRGEKIDNMLRAAEQFVNQMGDDDAITIIAFSDELGLVAEPQQVGPARAEIVQSIGRLEAAGDTALYDAIGAGAQVIGDTTASQATNALVVLTDGQDTYSSRYSFNQSLIDLAAANDTTVFTIAYGDDADSDVLSRLALGANGNFYLGDEASIAAIYQEMSAAFGGSVGVGR